MTAQYLQSTPIRLNNLIVPAFVPDAVPAHHVAHLHPARPDPGVARVPGVLHHDPHLAGMDPHAGVPGRADGDDLRLGQLPDVGGRPREGGRGVGGDVQEGGGLTSQADSLLHGQRVGGDVGFGDGGLEGGEGGDLAPAVAVVDLGDDGPVGGRPGGNDPPLEPSKSSRRVL